MTINSLYLDDQAGNTLTLVPNALITVTAITQGFPAIRPVVEVRPDTDGTSDTTSLIGARAFSISAGLYTTPAALADAWREFMAPGNRVYLYCYDTEWVGTRRILLRADQFADPIVEGADDIYRAVQAQWVAVDGVWEDAVATTVTIAATAPTSAGMQFPMSFPLSWASGIAVTGTIVTNNSALPLHFTANLYGICTGPALINDTVGQQLAFTSALILAAGSYVALSTRERTANLLSDPAQSQLGNMDLINSQWWQLQPGSNSVRFVPSAGVATGSSAVLTYRQTYL